MKEIVEVLKRKNYQVSESLLFNYKKLNITDSELIVLIYILNQTKNIYNPKQISTDLNMDMNSVLELVFSLQEKGILNIEISKIDGISNEIINLDLLYEKLALSIDTKEEDKSNIYTIFEEEFGRTLSPMEYEIINAWKEMGNTEELITLALKEAVYNGANNLRYMDKIIYEWNRKGIKTKEDVEKNRKEFKKKNEKNTELFEYDWLNEDN